jgi:sigma-B regulation protein RsbU (phosphoserine phosphatase)
VSPPDPKLLYRRIESAVERAAGPGSARRFAERLLTPLLSELGEIGRLRSVQLYEGQDGRLALIGQAGVDVPELRADLAARLAHRDAPPGELPWAGATAEGPAAVFPVTESADLLVALRFAPQRDQDAAEYLALAAPLQYAVQHQLRHRELEDAFEQARAIQTSLLPASPPRFGEFDIAAFSRPARRVGGDLYDLIALDDESIGIAVADASGHGLPAALQARDVVTGLRMGVERDLRLTRTIEKLNRVIHRSGLSSRFVSLVFAELEQNGNLLYVNAGHPPPLLCDDTGVHELTVGGALLGPVAEARYKMGFAHLDRGAVLLLYTDGLIERMNTAGEIFGNERLRDWLPAQRDVPAGAALDDLSRTLDAFAGRAAAEDDTTAVFVSRPR